MHKITFIIVKLNDNKNTNNRFDGDYVIQPELPQKDKVCLD